MSHTTHADANARTTSTTRRAIGLGASLLVLVTANAAFAAPTSPAEHRAGVTTTTQPTPMQQGDSRCTTTACLTRPVCD